MKGALIAHDNMKDDLVEFCLEHKNLLANFHLYATGTTGTILIEKTGLDIERVLSGPLGGDQQIGSLVAQEKVKFVIFLRDPLTAQPHEPDVQALLRLCDVHEIAIATNLTSADIILSYLEEFLNIQ